MRDRRHFFRSRAKQKARCKIRKRPAKRHQQGAAVYLGTTDACLAAPQNVSPRRRSRSFHRTREPRGKPPSIAQCALPHTAKCVNVGFRSNAGGVSRRRPSHACNVPDALGKTYFYRFNCRKFDRNIRQTIASQWFYGFSSHRNQCAKHGHSPWPRRFQASQNRIITCSGRSPASAAESPILAQHGFEVCWHTRCK